MLCMSLFCAMFDIEDKEVASLHNISKGHKPLSLPALHSLITTYFLYKYVCTLHIYLNICYIVDLNTIHICSEI